jgi:hypothetical protein
MEIFPQPEFDPLREFLDALLNDLAAVKIYEYRAVEAFRERIVATVGLMHPLANGDRIRQIISINCALRQGYARWLSSQSEISLYGIPAAEAVYMCPKPHPILWRRRWKQAGGTIRKGRMVALRNDPVWARLSFMGLPFAPFAPECPLNTIGVNRDDAIALGLNPQVPFHAAKIDFPKGILFFDMLPPV